MSRYSVEHRENEIVVKGHIPTSDLGALVRSWSERGYTLWDAERAREVNAAVVVVPEDGA